MTTMTPFPTSIGRRQHPAAARTGRRVPAAGGALLAAALLLLAGCDQANQVAAGVIGDDIARQTSAFQRATAAGDLRAVADEPVVDCKAEPEACGKLHGMRANACLTLAMNARTSPLAACPPSGAEVARWLDCADADYAAALPMLAPAARPGAQANRANALYCRAEGRTVGMGQADAAAAEQAGSQAGEAVGLLWAARGAVFQARSGASGDRCAALRRASALATRGSGLGNAATTPGFTALRADINVLRPTIPGCTI
jgi:hypothetical protein